MGGLVAHAVLDVQNGAAAQPRRAAARVAPAGSPRRTPAVAVAPPGSMARVAAS